MLHGVCVDTAEAVGAVAIAITMMSNLVQATAPRVVGGGARVESCGRGGVQILGIDADTWGRGRCEDVFDEQQTAGRVLQGEAFVHCGTG